MHLFARPFRHCRCNSIYPIPSHRRSIKVVEWQKEVENNKKEHLFWYGKCGILYSVDKAERTEYMRNLDCNGHSVFLMYYHLVLVVKYRRRVIDDAISQRGKEIFLYIAGNYGITLEEWNHDCDHVHILFRAQPKTELTRFINAYKSASSRLLKKEYPGIREKLWKDAFWSQSFCLLTTGGAPIETIRSYIETQGEKA